VAAALLPKTFEKGQFRSSVTPNRFLLRRNNGHRAAAGLLRDLDQVGQIILTLGVGICNLL